MTGGINQKIKVLVLATFVLSGCASSGSGKLTTIADMVGVFSFSGGPTVDASLGEKIQLDLNQQHPEAALERLHKAREAGYPQEVLAPHYPLVINALIKKAEASSANGEPARAGLLYRSALAGYPERPDTAGKILLPPGTLHQNLEQCADDLMQQGLMHYRAGHLDDAIAVWKKIGTFLPDHQPSLIAIETTRTQLHTLRHLGANQSN